MPRILALILGFGLVYLVFFHKAEPVNAKKLFIEVNTPHGLVSGSTIVELKDFEVPWWYPVGGARGGGAVSQGEALHVDLGGNKHLFVLMNDQMMTPIRDSLMPSRLEADGAFKPGSLPTMVTFTDMTDANSVHQVSPSNFSESFGEGYSLRSLRAFNTNEPATFGNLARMFPDLRRQLLQAPYTRLRAAGVDDYANTDIRLIQWVSLEDKRQ